MYNLGKMTTFKGWCQKFIKDNTPFGDIAREVAKGKCIPDFKKKEQVLNFVKQTWAIEAVSIIDEMYDLYDKEVIQPYQEQVNLYYGKGRCQL